MPRNVSKRSKPHSTRSSARSPASTRGRPAARPPAIEPDETKSRLDPGAKVATLQLMARSLGTFPELPTIVPHVSQLMDFSEPEGARPGRDLYSASPQQGRYSDASAGEARRTSVVVMPPVDDADYGLRSMLLLSAAAEAAQRVLGEPKVEPPAAPKRSSRRKR